MKKRKITTKEEARQYATDWQQWASEQNLSYGELADWQQELIVIGRKFGLLREFTENGII